MTIFRTLFPVGRMTSSFEGNAPFRGGFWSNLDLCSRNLYRQHLRVEKARASAIAVRPRTGSRSILGDLAGHRLEWVVTDTGDLVVALPDDNYIHPSTTTTSLPLSLTRLLLCWSLS